MAAANLRRLLGTFWLVGAGAISKLLFLGATVVIYKVLPPEKSGTFGLAYALGTTLVLLTELGLRGYVVRELARIRTSDQAAAQSLLSGVLWVRVGLSTLVLPASLVLVYFAGYASPVLFTTAAMLMFAVLDSFAILLKAVFRAYERMELDASASILSRALILVFLIICQLSGRLDLFSVSLSFVAGAAAECVALVWVAKKNLPLTLRSRPPAVGSMTQILLRSLPFAVLVGVGILYLRTSVFALSKLDVLRELVPEGLRSLMRSTMESPLEAVAWFTAASRIPEAVSFLPLAVVNAFIPYLSRHASDTPLIQRTFTPVLRYLGLMGIVIAAPIIAEPELVLRFLSREEFSPAAPAVRILAMTVPLTFTLYVMANFLICMGEERVVMRRYISALCMNVVLNLFFVPLWGVTGAALALALSEAAAVVLDLSVLYRKRVRIPGSVTAAYAGMILLALVTGAATQPLPPLARAMSITLVTGCGLLLLAWFFDRPTVLAIRAGRRSLKNPEQASVG